jgi:hypothetical protein
VTANASRNVFKLIRQPLVITRNVFRLRKIGMYAASEARIDGFVRNGDRIGVRCRGLGDRLECWNWKRRFTCLERGEGELVVVTTM